MASKAKKPSNLRPLTGHEKTLVGEHARRHGPVAGFTAAISDDAGNVSSPLFRLPLLHRLELHGDIGPQERAAGERFHELFHRAHLDPLRAADMGRVSGARAAGDLPPAGEHARRLVGEVIALLGGNRSPGGAAAWHVLGNDLSLAKWAQREGWNGRQVRHEVAKGVLLSVLGVLRQHFDSGRHPARHA